MGEAGGEQSVVFRLHQFHHSSVYGGRVLGAEGHNGVAVFLVVRPDKGEFLLVLGPNADLVVTGLTVDADEEQGSFGVPEVVQCIIATRYRVVESLGDGIERPVIYAKTPDEVADVGNVFLVWFRCKDYFGAPTSTTWPDPSFMEKVVDVLLHNPSFVDSIVRWLAADRLGGSCVEPKVEAANRAVYSFFEETVPVILDDRSEFCSKVGRHVVRDFNDSVKLCLVGDCVPLAYVVPYGKVKTCGGRAERFTITWEKEKVVVEFGSVIEGYVTCLRFRAPDFRRDGNGESGGVC